MSENPIQFSVVIPVYNNALTVGKAIESCLHQTVKPLEIILIDDASTDDTVSQIALFNSDKIVFIRNPVNSGPSYSRNAGIRKAKGNWILFLDADDSFHNRKIEILTRYVKQNPAAKAIGHSFRLNDDPEPIIPDMADAFVTVKKISQFSVLISNPVVTPALAVSAENPMFFNEAMIFAEDHDYILRTTEKFPLQYIDVPLCTLGRKPLSTGGISSDKWKMRKGEMKMYIDYCRRHHILLAVPLFIIFSLCKHCKLLLFS